MKHRLIPSGEIVFRGTQAQLLDTIQKAGGIMEAEGKFRCALPPPKHRGIQISFVRTRNRGLVLFQFLCEYEPLPGGFRIRYQVMPTFFTWSLPVVLAAMAIAACCQSVGAKVGLYPLWIVSMVIPPVLLYFLWARTKQTDHFLEFFKHQS